MTKEERKQTILHEASIHNRVLLNDLAIQLKVSIDTIRRDIIELDKEDKIIRTHGGAQTKSYIPYAYNSNTVYARKNKVLIAKKAIELVTQNSISLISGGTTNFELARAIPNDVQATFFTPSLPIAMQLLEHKNLEVIFLGGRLSNESKIALGGNVLNELSEISFDNCFLGTSYLDVKKGLTELDWEVVQLKKAMVRASNKIISLSIFEKLDTVQRYKVCDIDAIDILVTELDATDSRLKKFRRSGLELR